MPEPCKSVSGQLGQKTDIYDKIAALSGAIAQDGHAERTGRLGLFDEYGLQTGKAELFA